MVLPRRFPHFKKIETEIMKRFLAGKYIMGKYTFDYRLPVTIDPRWEMLPPNLKKMMIALKQRRLDALCETQRVDYIIEVEPRLSSRGIGQLLTYKHIYMTKVKPGKRIELVSVVASADKDTLEVAKAHGITVYVV